MVAPPSHCEICGRELPPYATPMRLNEGPSRYAYCCESSYNYAEPISYACHDALLRRLTEEQRAARTGQGRLL